MGSPFLTVTSMRWFVSRSYDLTFFHVPIWLGWLVAFALPEHIRAAALPLWIWVSVVLLVDVGHVWSTIYRTLFDPGARRSHSRLLKVVPIACFVPCLLLALHSDELFWRVLAYVAVYHFIKQQVGFAALYRARSLKNTGVSREQARFVGRIDKLAIYTGTLFPVLIWHLTPGKQINWFIPGDFIPLAGIKDFLLAAPGGPILTEAAFWLGHAFWIWAPAWWLLVHLRLVRKTGMPFPTGKALWVMGTWINWYLGIVYFDSDLIFTLTNVIAHGIPYYALIGIYGHRKLNDGGYGRSAPRPPTARPARVLFYGVLLLPVLMLALGEEYLWDFLIYRDYSEFFQILWAYPREMISQPVWRAVWMALLSMPQVIHYILDGFIWKFNASNPDLPQYLLPSQTAE